MREGSEATGEHRHAAALPDQPPCPEPDAHPFRLARQLENDGKPEEARAVVRPMAAAAVRDLAAVLAVFARPGPAAGKREVLHRLLEFRPFRGAFLAELNRRPAGRVRVAAAMRAALRAAPDRADVRTLLADVLLASGRAAEAEQLVASAFAPGAAGAPTSRVESVLALVDRGRYGSRLERAVLSCVRAAGPRERLLTEWTQLFAALMCARKYSAAFRLGETMLDRLGRFDSPQPLMWPWWRKHRRAVAEWRFLADELRRIRAAERRGDLPHWYAYYRALLSSYAGDWRTANDEYPNIRKLDPVRYSWMRQAFVLVFLGTSDFDAAVAVSRDILRHCPDHWWVRCRMAEAFLAGGDRRRALAELRRAARCADKHVRREVRTWHGEVLLWLGEYRAALRKLDAAVRLGATTFVFGWRGAARFKLGDFPGALDDLDRAIALDPKDLEAVLWRGEVCRVLGRPAEARRDLDRFIAQYPTCTWGFLNRGLLRHAQGDVTGVAEDFARIPVAVVDFLRRALGFPPDHPLGTADMCRLMTAGLDLAAGVRRWEPHVNVVWMSRVPEPVGPEKRRRPARPASPRPATVARTPHR
ncbi:MAG: tetratricopeptide repeat protein [Deltaproteobacteria bacterium]|nr:tetratricopeptide repeat protein [Deltaproteobacteria bacterium]